MIPIPQLLNKFENTLSCKFYSQPRLVYTFSTVSLHVIKINHNLTGYLAAEASTESKIITSDGKDSNSYNNKTCILGILAVSLSSLTGLHMKQKHHTHLLKLLSLLPHNLSLLFVRSTVTVNPLKYQCGISAVMVRPSLLLCPIT